MTKKFQRRLFWTLTIIFLIVSPPIILYTTGWRLTPDLEIKRTGGLFVTTGQSGVEIYIDGELKKRTNLLQNTLFSQGLTPKKITIIAAKEGSWPWTKELKIEESSVTEVRTLLVPTDLDGRMVLRGSYDNIYHLPDTDIIMLEKTKNDILTYEFYLPEKNEFLTTVKGKALLSPAPPFKTFLMEDNILKLVFNDYSVDISFDLDGLTLEATKSASRNQPPTSPLPHKTIFDSRKATMIWISDNNKEIWAEWTTSDPLPFYFGEKKMSIFNSTNTEIKSIGFFPKRRDVILLALTNGIFALELDGRGTRNFQPIYKGKNPSFTVINNIVYILDDGLLSKMTL